MSISHTHLVPLLLYMLCFTAEKSKSGQMTNNVYSRPLNSTIHRLFNPSQSINHPLLLPTPPPCKTSYHAQISRTDMYGRIRVSHLSAPPLPPVQPYKNKHCVSATQTNVLLRHLLEKKAWGHVKKTYQESSHLTLAPGQSIKLHLHLPALLMPYITSKLGPQII